MSTHKQEMVLHPDQICVGRLHIANRGVRLREIGESCKKIAYESTNETMKYTLIGVAREVLEVAEMIEAAAQSNYQPSMVPVTKEVTNGG